MAALNGLNRTLITLAVVSGLSACGSMADKMGLSKDDNSKLDTLDNLARGDRQVSPNECGVEKLDADKKVVIKDENIRIVGMSSEVQAKKLREHTYRVISNIPQSVLTVFFALDGVVEINRNASKICRDLQNGHRETDGSQYSEDEHLVSCWKRNDKGAATIYVDPNKIVSDGEQGYLGIDHGLIRSFGYVVAEMFLKLEITADSANQHKWHVKELAQPKGNDQLMLVNLAEAFVQDVEDSGGKYSLDDYKSLLEGAEAQKQKFRFFVFAEAFDSYYCSAQTKELVKQDFPGTYKAMNLIVRSLSDETTDGSMALTNSSYGNPCNCFGGIGSILGGIFAGIRNIVLGAVEIVHAAVIGAFRVVMIPFKAVFGAIFCVFEPVEAGEYIGTTPVRGGAVYRSPLQHPCQGGVSQSNKTSQSSCQHPGQNDGGASVDKEESVVDKDKKNKKAPVSTTVTSTTATDEGTPVVKDQPKAAKKAKKKWYQCGTLGGNEATGTAPLAILLLMALPLLGLGIKRQE